MSPELTERVAALNDKSRGANFKATLPTSAVTLPISRIGLVFVWLFLVTQQPPAAAGGFRDCVVAN